MSYTHVLIDLDHTLLDTDTSLVAAFDEAMIHVGAEPDGRYGLFDRINRDLWAGVERGETTPVEVSTKRFRLLIAELGLDADAVAMAAAFEAGLGCHGELYDGAHDVLTALAAQASLALVTNGLSGVQRTRIERLGLAHYFDAVVISAEVGAAKPGGAIFDLTFEALGDPERAGALMVGDSLTSDIAGGRNYGIATCWYNPAAGTAPSGQEPTHQIAALHHLPALVFSV